MSTNAAFKESSKINLLHQTIIDARWHFQLEKPIVQDFLSHLDHPYKGVREAIKTVIDARPDTFNHNIETVPRLYPAVRPQAKFKRSLEVLRYAKELNPDGLTKSGFMVGLGEVEEEIHQTMKHLREHDVDILTIGQ